MKKSALFIAARMNLPPYAHDAMRYDRHPQDRTLAFHRFYGQPIGPTNPDRGFSHMDDQRVAFRASFILSEVAEMLRDGLGVELVVGFGVNGMATGLMHGDEDAKVCTTLHSAIAASSKRDLLGVADALGDLNVVVNGFAIELGMDMKRVDQEICASNFTKADENGAPIIGDGVTGPVGKVLKGPKFLKPQLATTLGLENESE